MFLGYCGPVSEAREERLAHNEVVFRAINEQIEGIAIRLGDDVLYEFVCECATAECFERLPLSIAEYEEIRTAATRFVLVPGHEDMEVERVVESRAGYVIVEKDGVAGLVAADASTRE